jgi:hypothetical protein
MHRGFWWKNLEGRKSPERARSTWGTILKIMFKK